MRYRSIAGNLNTDGWTVPDWSVNGPHEFASVDSARAVCILGSRTERVSAGDYRELSANLPLAGRMAAALGNGAMSSSALAEAIDANPGSVPRDSQQAGRPVCPHSRPEGTRSVIVDAVTTVSYVLPLLRDGTVDGRCLGEWMIRARGQGSRIMVGAGPITLTPTLLRGVGIRTFHPHPTPVSPEGRRCAVA